MPIECDSEIIQELSSNNVVQDLDAYNGTTNFTETFGQIEVVLRLHQAPCLLSML